MNVLQLTPHFLPNMGGVETHLADLVNALIKRHHKISVLTYRPLTTKAKWKLYENKEGLEILRIPWIPGLFYKFVNFPAGELLYLLPGIFFLTPVMLFLKNPSVIHAHGLTAGLAGVFWGKIFHKKVIVSTHSIYSFPKKGLYRKTAEWIFQNASFCLGLSEQAKKEIISLGVLPKRAGNFTYWIDLKKFHPDKNLKRDKKFSILFVGRLVEEKGILVLLDAVKQWNKNIILRIIGSGPLEGRVKDIAAKYANINFTGRIEQDKLPAYYASSDILIAPSIHEEGFGRVILESLACGTPVIGAKRGGIKEAMNDSVGRLIKISPDEITKIVSFFYRNKDKLRKLAQNCRKFAERRFSEKNVEAIIRSYRS